MGTHIQNPTRPKARKQHQCIACFANIEAGETYVQQSGHFEDQAFRNRFHIECWDCLSEDGDFEFTPGELPPPERAHSQSNAALSGPQPTE